MLGGTAVLFGAVAIGSAASAAPPPEPPTTTAATTTAPASTEPPPTPFVHPDDVHDPPCVIEIQEGDSLSIIAEAMPDTAVSYDDLAEENGITDPDAINSGSYLDICVGNQVDDISGGDRSESATVEIVDEQIAAQQRQINALFAGMGVDELLVDGVSGRLTQRSLCAFRSAFGLPISRADMVPGSTEEQLLMSVTSLPLQPGAPDHWVLVDKTCQVMFGGQGEQIVHLWAVSTGEAGHETRDQQGSDAFRFDPAVDNDGWHNSSTYPAAVDNPLNGNMYKPVYFDRGQAIHGSYNVPTEPLSKGCVRLLVDDHDAFLAWIGLGGETRTIWDDDEIDLVVDVRGEYAGA